MKRIMSVILSLNFNPFFNFLGVLIRPGDQMSSLFKAIPVFLVKIMLAEGPIVSSLTESFCYKKCLGHAGKLAS